MERTLSLYPQLKKLVVPALLGILLLSQSCETDIQVNADKEDVTILYGILDQNETRHYIKINKAFLEEGDAFVFAGQEGITDYNDLTGVVEETNENGNVVNTYTLLRDTLTTKEDGLFHSPNHILYYFDKTDLNVDNDYTIKLSIGETEEQKTVSATTNLVKPFEFTGRLKFQSAKIALASRTGYSEEAEFTWASGINGRRFQMTIQFTYYDILTSGDTVKHVVDWELPDVKSPTPDREDELKVRVNGEDFYRFLGERIPAFNETPGLAQRIPCPFLNFIVDAAAEDLSIYIDVNSPSTGIIQERPEYTNVENGFGIFSSRYRQITSSKLDGASIDELADAEEPWSGQYTAPLGFCHPETECTFCTQ